MQSTRKSVFPHALRICLDRRRRDQVLPERQEEGTGRGRPHARTALPSGPRLHRTFSHLSPALNCPAPGPPGESGDGLLFVSVSSSALKQRDFLSVHQGVLAASPDGKLRGFSLLVARGQRCRARRGVTWHPAQGRTAAAPPSPCLAGTRLSPRADGSMGPGTCWQLLSADTGRWSGL